MAPADPETEEHLKSALWYAIGQIVDHETLKHNANATPQFIGALTEMVWAQIASAAKDLEAFAKHAGRSQINADDVLLLARRNDGLDALLRGFLDEYRADMGKGKNTKTGKARLAAGAGGAKKR